MDVRVKHWSDKLDRGRSQRIGRLAVDGQFKREPRVRRVRGAGNSGSPELETLTVKGEGYFRVLCSLKLLELTSKTVAGSHEL
jgi:hypothetical protein